MCHLDNTAAAAVAQVNRLHSTDPQAGHVLQYHGALLSCRPFLTTSIYPHLCFLPYPDPQQSAPILRTAIPSHTVQKHAKVFLQEGLVPATQKVYQAGLNRYKNFTCTMQLPVLHLTQEKVMLFGASWMPSISQNHTHP